MRKLFSVAMLFEGNTIASGYMWSENEAQAKTNAINHQDAVTGKSPILVSVGEIKPLSRGDGVYTLTTIGDSTVIAKLEDVEALVGSDKKIELRRKI